MNKLGTAARAYATTRWTTASWRSRASFEAWQQRHLHAWLGRAPKTVRFYESTPPDLSAFPIIEKATVMAAFADFNRPRITDEEVWQAVAGTRRIGDFITGASTGTSGNRGLFIIDERERFAWLGTILAKALPGFWRRQERVAIVLPTHTPIYDSANATRRVVLKFFDLSQPIGDWLAALEVFAPSVLVAPPKVLRHFAERGVRLSPRLLFSAAETLDPVDRDVIRRGFGGTLGEIYMATEGLLGVTCACGALHLAEDCHFFEFEDAGGGLVSPLITSFRRDVQILARYRMNDLLRLSDEPCPCGSPLRVAREIVGRMDDVFALSGVQGPVSLTPDVLRNVILDADRSITDFRLKLIAASEVLLILPRTASVQSGEAARNALLGLFARHGALAKIDLRYEDLPLDTKRKLRRVENLCAGCAA